MQKAKDKQEKKENNDTVVEQMFKAGAHYGYSKSRRHPSVSSFIYATKNKADIINLEKTEAMLAKASEFVKNLGAQGKTVLLIGTKPEAKDAIRTIALSLNMPFVTERWIGGTISNFMEIKKRIAELENYHKENKEGGLEKYTKKERVVLAKKMEKLSKYYSGLLNLKKSPDALFVIDARAEHIAVTEARKADIPVISLVNSDSDIRRVDYPIVANDSGVPSIKFFAGVIAENFRNGISSLPAKTA